MAAPGAARAGPAAPATPPAQTAPPAPRAPAIARRRSPAPGHLAPEGTHHRPTGGVLGDKLAKSDGVLCPPAGVDPEIRAPTPMRGNTPVIPPPGSPGGDPRPAKIEAVCNDMAGRLVTGLLDMPLTGFLYAARSRLRHIKPHVADAVAG